MDFPVWVARAQQRHDHPRWASAADLAADLAAAADLDELLELLLLCSASPDWSHLRTDEVLAALRPHADGLLDRLRSGVFRHHSDFVALTCRAAQAHLGAAAHREALVAALDRLLDIQEAPPDGTVSDYATPAMNADLAHALRAATGPPDDIHGLLADARARLQAVTDAELDAAGTVAELDAAGTVADEYAHLVDGNPRLVDLLTAPLGLDRSWLLERGDIGPATLVPVAARLLLREPAAAFDRLRHTGWVVEVLPAGAAGALVTAVHALDHPRRWHALHLAVGHLVRTDAPLEAVVDGYRHLETAALAGPAGAVSWTPSVSDCAMLLALLRNRRGVDPHTVSDRVPVLRDVPVVVADALPQLTGPQREFAEQVWQTFPGTLSELATVAVGVTLQP